MNKQERRLEACIEYARLQRNTARKDGKEAYKRVDFWSKELKSFLEVQSKNLDELDLYHAINKIQNED